MALVDVLRAAISEIEQYERVVLNVQPGIVVVGQAVNDVVHLVAEIVENATTFSPEDTQVYISGQPLSSGGVLLDITDNGVGISDQEMSHANWRLDNPPVVDVAVSRRMGLFVVGRLAARHGVRVRLRHAQVGGLTALIWLPDTVAAPEVAPPLGRLRRFEADDFGPAPSLSAPTQTASPSAASQATAAARIPRFSPGAPTASPEPAPFGSASPGTAPQGTQPGSGPQTPPGTQGSGGAAAGLGDGGMAAARSGWDMGGGSWGDRDEPATQALPIRNTNGNGNWERPRQPGRTLDQPVGRRGLPVGQPTASQPDSQPAQGPGQCRPGQLPTGRRGPGHPGGSRRSEQAARVHRAQLAGTAGFAVPDRQPERPRQRRAERVRRRRRGERAVRRQG